MAQSQEHLPRFTAHFRGFCYNLKFSPLAYHNDYGITIGKVTTTKINYKTKKIWA